MRFFAPLALILSCVGCAGPGVSTPLPRARVSPPPPNAFALSAEELKAEPEEIRLGVALEDLLADPFRSGDQLVELVKTFVTPGAWKSDALTFDLPRSVLKARHSPRALAATDLLLKTQHQNRDRQIQAAVSLFSLGTEDLRLFENIPPGAGGLAGTFGHSALRETLFRALGARARGCLPSPLRFAHGHSASFRNMSQMAFISGWVETEAGPDPLVDVITDGVQLVVRAVANGNRPGEFVADVSAEVAVMLEPMPQVLSLNLGAGPVELPGKVTARFQGKFTLGPEQVLFGIVRNPDFRHRKQPILGIALKLDWAP